MLACDSRPSQSAGKPGRVATVVQCGLRCREGNPAPDLHQPQCTHFLLTAAGMATEQFTDFVVGHGELWCAQLFAASCRQQGARAQFMDARDVLVV